MKDLFYLFILSAVLFRPSQLFAQPAKHETVMIIQGSNVYIVSSEDTTLTLDRQSFTIRYFCRRYEPKTGHYAMRIAILTHADAIHAGMGIDGNHAKIPYFGLGSGLAATVGIIDTLFVDDEAHNFIYYKDEADRRADLVTRHEKYLELQIPVKGLYYQGRSIPIQDIKFNDLWFILLNDDNLNETIDPGELHKVHVKFR
jgi:hypothetical protein